MQNSSSNAVGVKIHNKHEEVFTPVQSNLCPLFRIILYSLFAIDIFSASLY